MEQVRAFEFKWARMDMQGSPSAEEMRGMMDDCQMADLRTLPIVYDLTRLQYLSDYFASMDTPLDDRNVEWSNEMDGDIRPETYRKNLEAACTLAEEQGILLWGPCISNLDRDSLMWMEAVRRGRWPDGLYGISFHRYGDGTFEFSHQGFDNRDQEVEALRDLSDGRPLMCTEFGYPTDKLIGQQSFKIEKRRRFLRPNIMLSEEQAADNISKEWKFWHDHDVLPFLYQINDGTTSNETYGIRRCLPDGTLTGWKPSAYTVPQETEPMPDIIERATYFISMKLSFEVPDKKGYYRTYYPKFKPNGELNKETILSIQPDGSKATRLVAEGGAWETWKPNKAGNRSIFDETSESYAIPLDE
jgi:hypothetical protein